ncbi:MAG: hypothetical protein IJO75_05155 [Clostridia bacterium]|nr:hypothetical protein [Clostridia bacterium]
MKKFFKSIDQVFAYYFISMGISLLVGILLDFPIKMLFHSKGVLTEFIIGIISACASLFVLCYRAGYHSTKLELKPFIRSVGLFLVLLIVITCLVGLIGPAIYISGPTNTLAHYIVDQAGLYLMDRKVALYCYCPLFMTIAYVFLYAPFMILGKHLGFKRKQSVFKS